MRDLVAREGETEPGKGPAWYAELREALGAHAAAAPDAFDDVEVMLASRASGSPRFAFDAFGRLCAVSDRIAEMGVSACDALATEGADVPEAALEGASLALAACDAHAYPTMAETFVPCMAHAAVRRVGRTAEEQSYHDVVLSLIEGSEDLVEACEAHVLLRLAETGDKGALALPAGDAWDEAARRVCGRDATLAFDDVSRELAERRPRVTAWLEGAELDARDRTVTRDYLRGLTLERCASTWMLTPEQVNGCVRRVLRSAPPVLEDRDRHLFETYSISRAEFLEVTGEDVACYRYLRATSDETGAAPLAQAVEDPCVPASQRDAIRDLLGWGAPEATEAPEGQDHDDVRPTAGAAGPAPLAPAATPATAPGDAGDTPQGAPKAREGFFSFRDNQRGVSYETLFGPYFEGARHVRIVDPYVRHFHQARNIMELMAVLVRHRDFSQDAPTVHLLTGHAETDAAKQRDYLRKIELALAAQGITFTWECDLTRSLHARHVFVDDTWDIALDRGLDFWQRYDFADAFSFEAYVPEMRRVKRFEISYRRLDGEPPEAEGLA